MVINYILLLLVLVLINAYSSLAHPWWSKKSSIASEKIYI